MLQKTIHTEQFHYIYHGVLLSEKGAVSQKDMTYSQTVPPPPPSAPPTPGYQVGRSFGEDDRRALRRIRLFAVISLITEIIGLTSGYVFLSSLSGSMMFSFSSTSPSQVASFFSRNLGIFYVDLAIGSLLPIVWMMVLRTAFSSLAKVDRSSFRTPSRLIILLIIAAPIAFAGVVLLFSSLASFLSQMAALAQNPSYSSSPPILPSNFASFLAGIGIVAVAAIVYLVGFIGSVILGLWRTGNMFGQDLLKVAAVLIIFPYTNVVASIFAFLGAREAEKKI